MYEVNLCSNRLCRLNQRIDFQTVWEDVRWNSATFELILNDFLIRKFQSETLNLVPQVTYLFFLLPDDIWLDRVLAVSYSKLVSIHLTYHLFDHTSHVANNIVRGLSNWGIKTFFIFYSLLTLSLLQLFLKIDACLN